MRKLTRRELLSAAGATGVALASKSFAFPTAPESFEFVYFSDTHVALDRNIKENAEMFAAIKGESTPAFAINGGDVTDYGWAGEYDNYEKLKREFGIKTYENMGNHDVRWSPQGEKIFGERLGPAYQWFFHKDVFFAILDSTVPLSHWGHYTDTQLSKLEQQLQQLPQGTPVIVATHHWVGRDQVMIDNENTLREILRKYNTKLILTGHGHSDLLWQYDGMTCTMNKGLYQGSWQKVEVDRALGEIRLLRYTKDSGKLKLLTRVPLEFSARENLSHLPLATLLSNPGFTEIKINDLPWQHHDPEANLNYKSGYNDIQFRGNSNFATANKYVFNERFPETAYVASGPPSSLASSGPVMSHLHAIENSIYYSTLTGQAVKASTKLQPGSFASDIERSQLKGYIHSAPTVHNEFMFVGDSTGVLAAIKNKSTTWRAQLPGPIYARPIIAQNTLVVGNHGAFFGFDPETGKQVWRTPMPKSNTAFTQSEPCTDGTRVYITCWDSHIYCLDAKTGEIVWRKPCQERTFAFSPAIGSPCLDDDSVYCVANGNGLFRFNKFTGEQHYEVAAPGDKFGHSSPVHHEGRIYAGGLGDNGSVWCVNAKTGEIIWECKTGSVIYDSSPTIGHGLLAIGNAEGILNIIRIRDGKLLTQHRLGGLFLSTPLIHNRKLYAATFRGILHTFDLSKLIEQV
ncbi:MAG: PQQ-binding-like beta-propeller repeat protein [Fimbriimonadaceae bacterium]|nr:PQQ-binding-like beta-propeller repeat protein [Fimbriimonadaceae bacterium]